MAKSKSPAFQFYPDAWLSSTDILLMSPAEEGAYLRLLCHAWLQPDCGLPDDDTVLAVLSRLGKSWRKSAEIIRRKFFSRDGRLFNERQLEERAKRNEFLRQSSEAGKQSAAKRATDLQPNPQQNAQPNGQPNGKVGSTDLQPTFEPNGKVGSTDLQFRLQPKSNSSSSFSFSKRKVKTKTKRGDFPAVVERFADRMHGRHPRGPDGDRAGSWVVVCKHLLAIVKPTDESTWESQLAKIDANHEAWCPYWSRDNAQYAKALENWLAPTMRRFDMAPPSFLPSAAKEYPKVIV